MKKIILLFAVLLSAVTFANVDSLSIGLDTLTFLSVETPTEITTPIIHFDKITFIDVIIPAIVGLVSALFTDTLKHFKNGTWDFKVFLKTKLLPLATTLLLLLVVYGVWMLLGDKFSFVLETFRDNLGLFGFSGSFVIASVIDQLLKVNKDKPQQINS